MPAFRKKPVIVEAVRTDEPMLVETLEGTMQAQPGDWIIKGVKKELYPCQDDIFRQTYEPVDKAGVMALAAPGPEDITEEEEPCILPFPTTTTSIIA